MTSVCLISYHIISYHLMRCISRGFMLIMRKLDQQRIESQLYFIIYILKQHPFSNTESFRWLAPPPPLPTLDLRDVPLTTYVMTSTCLHERKQHRTIEPHETCIHIQLFCFQLQMSIHCNRLVIDRSHEQWRTLNFGDVYYLLFIK